MTLLEEIIAYLDLRALDIGQRFPAAMPTAPDRCVVVARYGGPESSLADDFDEPRLQFRVRGPTSDPRIAERDAETVYRAVHGLRRFYLPGGTWLQLAVALQSGPVFIGLDKNSRPEYTINVRCEIRQPATNRST